ncbi:MAG: hypothetical protein RSE57_02110 [Clostridia bacterium]
MPKGLIMKFKIIAEFGIKVYNDTDKYFAQTIIAESEEGLFWFDIIKTDDLQRYTSEKVSLSQIEIPTKEYNEEKDGFHSWCILGGEINIDINSFKSVNV